MHASNWPTQSPEALMSFVDGRDRLGHYLQSGRANDLESAQASFAEAERSDPTFALAIFYLAVVESELRDSDSAISRLEIVAKMPVDFLPETYLQLAYAHTKKYEDSNYFEAERALDRAQKEAEAKQRRDMIPVIRAYRTFLFSVMGGRLREKEARKPYIDKAIKLGSELLAERSLFGLRERDRDQVLFEVHNALGISYMRRGQQEEPFGDAQRQAWALADNHYAQALRIRPNATRVLQNVGTLRRAEGDQFQNVGDIENSRECYRVALDLYRRSLELNPRDQFPHYRVSELAAKLGDWETAQKHYDSGRREKGAVKEGTWERLLQAIKTKDASPLLTYD